jgi:hypothetical protein
MAKVAAWLREITALGPDGATPKVSPLRWAELEIMSSGSYNCMPPKCYLKFFVCWFVLPILFVE